METLNVSYFNIIRKKYDNDNNKLYYEYDKYKGINIYDITAISSIEFSSMEDCITYFDNIYKKTTDEINEHIENCKFNEEIIISYVNQYNNGMANNIEVKFPKNNIGLYENSYVDFTTNKFYTKFND